uniref:Uncharacterized protein n=1 Tax=Rhipicephalus microplus TaxID=6941 RepID=A0A6G5AGL9_RHIMP
MLYSLLDKTLKWLEYAVHSEQDFCNRGSGGSSAIKFLEQMHTKAVGRCQLVFSCLCGLVLQRDACATVICLVFFYIYTSAPQPTAELVKKKLQHSHNLTVQ